MGKVNIDRYLSGNFLTKEDCGAGETGTILDLDIVEVTNNGRKTDKLSVVWREKDLKPWLPSKGCARELREGLGGDTDNWIGATVELFNDESVEMAGARVGGIRVRTITPKPGSQQGLPKGVTDEDVPFDLKHAVAGSGIPS